MPVEPNYSVPGWIHGANPLQAVEAGASLGVRIAESNQRAAIAYAEMQRRQQEFQAQMEMEQQRNQQQQEFQQQRFQAQQQVQQQEQLRDDQKLQIENAYRQGQLGLQKQKLELTAQAAAQKMQAQEKFLFDRETIKNSLIYEEGVDPSEAERQATIQAMFRNAPGMGISPASLSGLARAAQGNKAAEWKTSPSGMPYAQEPSGNIRFEPRPVPTVQLEDKERIKDATRDIVEIQKELRAVQSSSLSDDDKQKKEIPIQERLYNAQAKRHKIFQKAQKTTAPVQATPAEAAPAAAPKTFGAPQQGQIIGGYEFQGGDPSDQKNWKPVAPSDDSEE